ncbi:MAG: fused MFS/spermidine synthase [Acidobacteriota bacterium]
MARKRGRIRFAEDGEQLELLVDDIAYSSFHPDRPWSGYVWDALAASILLVRSERPKVLVLGAGGGTALRLMHRLRPEAQLTAIEIDPRMLKAARRRFGLDEVGAELIEGDGLEFLARSRRRFDLILDDMFGPSDDGLVRPVDDEEAHLRRIASRLREGGIAATNSTTDDDPPGLLDAVSGAHRTVFPHRVAIEPPLGLNVVIAGSATPLHRDGLRRRRGVDSPMDLDALGRVKMRRA